MQRIDRREARCLTWREVEKVKGMGVAALQITAQLVIDVS